MIKKYIAIFIGLAIVAVLFISPSMQEILPLNNNDQASTSASESANEYPDKQINNTTKQDSKVSREAQLALKLSNEIELAATKSELDQLMLDYNDNLKNTQIKKELETKMAVLIKKYNAQVLPIALDEIQKSDKSGS